MVVFFFALWNVLIAYNGLQLLGVKEWLRLTWSITCCLSVGCSLEVYLLYTIRRNGKRIITAFKELYQQFRNRKK